MHRWNPRGNNIHLPKGRSRTHSPNTSPNDKTNQCFQRKRTLAPLATTYVPTHTHARFSPQAAPPGVSTTDLERRATVAAHFLACHGSRSCARLSHAIACGLMREWYCKVVPHQPAMGWRCEQCHRARRNPYLLMHRRHCFVTPPHESTAGRAIATLGLAAILGMGPPRLTAISARPPDERGRFDRCERLTS